MKIILLTGLALLIIAVLYSAYSGRTEYLNDTDLASINIDKLKVLKELALSREDSVLLNIEELKKLDHCVFGNFYFMIRYLIVYIIYFTFI